MALRDSIKKKILISNITQCMTEGVIFSGSNMQYLNSAAEKMLGIRVPENEEILSCLDDKNPELKQAIRKALENKEKPKESVVPYFLKEEKRYYRIKSSTMRFKGEIQGVIITLDDVSELMQLRETAQCAETIQNLNAQLEERNQFLNKVFGKYLSNEIVRQILNNPDGMEMGGKKHNLTVLMSDLRGFSSISETMEPQDLLAMLNHYFQEMTEITHHYQGTIMEFVGDGILVTFGRPLKCMNHAEMAVCAAIQMQNRMVEVNKWNAAHGYPSMDMGIGINTGEAIDGNIGCERHVKYGVTGSMVNLCARIENYTVGGQILIGPGTKEAIETTLAVDQEMTVHPKGFQDSITVYQVTGIGKPYFLHYETVELEPKPLKKPFKVKISVIHDKISEDNSYEATVVALSDTSAIIHTEKELQLYDNLQMIYEARGISFCKVTAIKGEDIRIRFTYRAKG